MKQEEAYIWLKKAIEDGRKIVLMINSKTWDNFRKTMDLDDGDYESVFGGIKLTRYYISIVLSQFIGDEEYVFYAEDETDTRWPMGIKLFPPINVDWEAGNSQTVNIEEDIKDILSK